MLQLSRGWLWSKRDDEAGTLRAPTRLDGQIVWHSKFREYERWVEVESPGKAGRAQGKNERDNEEGTDRLQQKELNQGWSVVSLNWAAIQQQQKNLL